MKKTNLLAVLTAAVLAVPALALGPNGLTANLTAQNAAGNSGACTANSCLQQALQVSTGTIYTPVWSVQNTVSVQLTGTWSGTVTFQESQDEGATWANVPCQAVLTTGTNLSPIPVVSTTANGNWQCDMGGFTTFRAVASSFVSGSMVVVLEAYAAVGNESINSLPILSDSQQRLVTGASSGISYGIVTHADAGTTAHAMLEIQGPGTGRGYLRELTVCLDPAMVQGTAGPRVIAVYPTTAVPTNGTVQAPVAYDPLSAAYAGSVFVAASTTALATTPAVGSVTDATALDEFTLYVPVSVATTNPLACVNRVYDGTKGLQPIAFGGSNVGASFGDAGIAIADLTGGAGAAGTAVVTARISSEPK